MPASRKARCWWWTARWRRGKVRLIAENPAYAPIEFREGQELVVWGVVTSFIQKLK
jgi:SOS-response transcriptional repressor LexA